MAVRAPATRICLKWGTATVTDGHGHGRGHATRSTDHGARTTSLGGFRCDPDLGGLASQRLRLGGVARVPCAEDREPQAVTVTVTELSNRP